jgi:hypothetical protein
VGRGGAGTQDIIVDLLLPYISLSGGAGRESLALKAKMAIIV